MTEIPEHLLKRAEEAKAKAAAKKQGAVPAAESAASGGTTAGDAGIESSTASTSGIPAHLLERSRAAKERAAGGGEGGGVATQAPPTAAGAVARPAGPAPAVGPAGHTQRLLTVVKSGSIQDVKATPTDKVHTWPHLLVVEFVAALLMTAFVMIFSIFVNAPLLGLANYNLTPNPSKAPWYFLGLQELLSMFHPMVAGVTIPGMGIFLLILAPYMDRNPSNRPEDRKFAISIMTVHLMFWAILVILGSFFRGPGFNFVFPWKAGLFFDL
jgi:menaquinol-cytochrome c reductase cytochrome b/c subunit